MPPNKGTWKKTDIILNGTTTKPYIDDKSCDSNMSYIPESISGSVSHSTDIPLPPIPLNTSNIQIKFLNMNVAFMPTIASMFTVVKNRLGSEKKRLRALVDVIQRADYDVVCLQEMWNHRIRNKFLDMIKAKYKPNEWLNHLHGERDENYYSICPQDIRHFSFVRMSTGLVILSKYPIVNASMWQYMSHSIGSDFFAQKGILYVELNVQGQPVHLATTHLQAPPDSFPTWWYVNLKGPAAPQSKKVRFDQLAELDRQIKVLAALLEKHHKDKVNMLVCGDFNVARGGDEYEEMLATLSHPTDIMSKFYQGNVPHLLDSDELTMQGKMDYIFTWENGQQPFENRIEFDKVEFVEFHKRYPDIMPKPFSDHPGIEAIINITPKPDVRL